MLGRLITFALMFQCSLALAEEKLPSWIGVVRENQYGGKDYYDLRANKNTWTDKRTNGTEIFHDRRGAYLRISRSGRIDGLRRENYYRSQTVPHYGQSSGGYFNKH